MQGCARLRTSATANTPQTYRAFIHWSDSTEDSTEVRRNGVLRSSHSSTLSIWPYDTPHRLATLQRSLRLFAGRSPTATRKKSPTRQQSCWQPPFKRSRLKGAKSPITMVGRGRQQKSERLLCSGVESVSIPFPPKWLKSSVKKLSEKSLGPHQATHHPYHQPHGPIMVQLLLSYQRMPRLEVEG
jgi:hypothetical protein